MNDGLKMRASVRMTRYLESWGAVKPFAHLQNREGYTADTIVNGKSHCKVNMFLVFSRSLREQLLVKAYCINLASSVHFNYPGNRWVGKNDLFLLCAALMLIILYNNFSSFEYFL